jgi:hypothetical protein
MQQPTQPPRVSERPRGAARPGSRAWPLLLASLASLACARTPPPTVPAQRALVRDLERVVDVRTSTGWLIDENELIVAVPDALKAACQTLPEDRRAALAWMDLAIEREGGDVVARWRERGKELSEVKDLLRLTRMRLVLRRADEWVLAGRCPFWLEPTERFAGVHTQGGRFILTLEGGGRVIEEFALGRVKYGGGGAGRVLLGYGFGERWALSTGFELGGSARFTNLQLGEQSDLPEVVALAAAPVVLRFVFGITAHAELEAGPIAFIDQGRADPVTQRVTAQYDWGARIGLAVGGSFLRLQRAVIPKFAVSLTVDHVPGDPNLTQIGIGVRTGVDFSRWSRF